MKEKMEWWHVILVFLGTFLFVNAIISGTTMDDIERRVKALEEKER